MAIDSLQEKIRKTKNPTVLVLPPRPQALSGQLLHGDAQAVGRFCEALLSALKGTVPAVRFRFGAFALLGAQGVPALQDCLRRAHELGYYVLLDAPELYDAEDAQLAADTLLGGVDWACDGAVISAYLGSDAVRPFLPHCKGGKDLFLLARTSNRSASEVQDLIAGGRHVYSAAADLAARFGGECAGKCGYDGVGVVAAAGAADSTRALREKYRHTFLLLEGFDSPSANAKKCSYAFDRLGHGAAVCVGAAIYGAPDFAAGAVREAERIRSNLTRYVPVL